MATNIEFVNHVCEQIKDKNIIKYRKMFGEYLVYINEKPLLLLCDNIVYIKMFEEIKQLMENSTTGFPYKGAKEHYILDIDNKKLITKILNILI